MKAILWLILIVSLSVVSKTDAKRQIDEECEDVSLPEMAHAKIIGAPHLFLNKRFPTWKEDNKTYMIPPLFNAKQSHHQIGIQRLVPYSDPGEHGESIVYNLLRQLGELKDIGMFVIHGFELKDIPKWNDKICKSDDYLVPSFASKTGECDFIVFHHKLGIISIEVKNDLKVRDRTVETAETQLKTSHDLVAKLAGSPELNDEKEDISQGPSKPNAFNLPYKKVIALPSTKKSDFDRPKYPSLKDDTLLLFEDDSQDIESFQKWWQEKIESPAIAQMSPETQEAYELALSFILMIRHIGPVTETDCMADLHESLISYKYHGKVAYPQVMESEFPYLWKWCWDVLDKKDKKFDFGDGNREELKKSFMKDHKLSDQELRGRKLLKLLDKLFRLSKYIAGDTASLVDDVIATVIEDTYFLFFKNILRFINDMRQMWSQIQDEEQKPDIDSTALLEKYSFLRLESRKDLNTLDRHLSRLSFVESDKPSKIDKQLFESLTCQMRLKHARQPIVMTSEQLAVFEGPHKQLIIGPPGSGKTELMKFKALELQTEMKKCKNKKKIMYILANGSPAYPERNSLFYYHVKEFFKDASLIEVVTVVLEEESATDTEHTTSQIRKKIRSGDYEHAFVDEYWIGSKPPEHKIILELVAGIPGYVWISSVFNYRRDMIENNDRMKSRTKPLLTVLEQNNGVVNNITQVLRATNSIIDVERGYSELYRQRSYPYGTEKILGHSLEGLPVTWAVEDDVEAMYTRCVAIVNSAVKDVISLDAIRRDKLTLDPTDILIVDFSIRMEESRRVSRSLKDRLEDERIPVWTFEESLEDFMKCKLGKVTLLESVTRDASSFLDGVEWPMVVVILPSSVLLNTAKLADGAQQLRNYDAYISFFRAMVKLVVISDKWNNDSEFFKDVEVKLAK